MKRILIAFFALMLLLPATVGAESGDWNLHVGTGIYVSQLGFSRNIGSMEIGANVDSGFPNIFIYSLFSSDEPAEGVSKSEMIWENFKTSITSAVAGDIYFRYDVIPSDTFDLDFSVGLAGIYADLSLLKIVEGFVEAGMRLGVNFTEHSGIYLEANLPAYAVAAVKTDDGWSWGHGFLFSPTDSETPKTMLLVTGLFCTRIGYRHTF